MKIIKLNESKHIINILVPLDSNSLNESFLLNEENYKFSRSNLITHYIKHCLLGRKDSGFDIKSTMYIDENGKEYTYEDVANSSNIEFKKKAISYYISNIDNNTGRIKASTDGLREDNFNDVDLTFTPISKEKYTAIANEVINHDAEPIFIKTDEDIEDFYLKARRKSSKKGAKKIPGASYGDCSTYSELVAASKNDEKALNNLNTFNNYFKSNSTPNVILNTAAPCITYKRDNGKSEQMVGKSLTRYVKALKVRESESFKNGEVYSSSNDYYYCLYVDEPSDKGIVTLYTMSINDIVQDFNSRHGELY